VLAEACARRDRLGAGEAFDALRAGAVLVDIRPQINRDLEGGLPGAVVIERNVLDWRLDPASDARLPIAGYDLHINRVCNEGYASSLAAAALQNLGTHRATDLVGAYGLARRRPTTTEPAEPIDTQRTRRRSRSRPA
jgi:rhodanese-related sulfurtransferase